MKKQILDLGCANEKLAGKLKFPNYSFDGKIIGLDYIQSKESDVVCDLNKKKLPFKENTFDIVYAHHTLEHIKNIINVIPEVFRVLKTGGKFLIRVPYLCSVASFSELTHVTRFGWDTLDVFISNKRKHYARYDYQIKDKHLFKEIKRKLVFGKLHEFLLIHLLANKFPNVYEQFFAWILPAREMHWELEKE